MTIDLPGLASVRSNCKAVQRSIFERRNMRHFAGGSLAPYGNTPLAHRRATRFQCRFYLKVDERFMSFICTQRPTVLMPSLHTK